jgi:ATP adenylyltransferase
MRYIKHAGVTGCFFCAYLRRRDDRRNLIVARGRTCFTIINRFPYNTGHLMVAPLRHTAKLDSLRDDEILEMWKMTVRMLGVLDRAMRPHGYNIGINLGRIAGAGVPGHAHIHIVPRWSGDTNYMPVVGHAKVMPMALDDLYRALVRGLNSKQQKRVKRQARKKPRKKR